MIPVREEGELGTSSQPSRAIVGAGGRDSVIFPLFPREFMRSGWRGTARAKKEAERAELKPLLRTKKQTKHDV